MTMTPPPRLWSQMAVVVTGVFCTPLVAVLLQCINYREAGRVDEVRRCGRWLAGLFGVLVVFNALPLSLSWEGWKWANAVCCWLLLAVWYPRYGRHFRARVGLQVLATARERHPFFAVLIGVAFLVVAPLVLVLLFDLLRAIF